MSVTENPTISAAPKSFAQSPLVTLVVGPDKVEFTVHAEILTQNSEYFEQALADQFSKGIKDVRLELMAEYETPTAVGAMIGGMYGQHQKSLLEYDELIDCYKLADCMGLHEWKMLVLIWTEDRESERIPPVFSHLTRIRSYGLDDTKFHGTICEYLFDQLVTGLAEDDDGKDQMIRNRISIEEPVLVPDVIVVVSKKTRIAREYWMNNVSGRRSRSRISLSSSSSSSTGSTSG